MSPFPISPLFWGLTFLLFCSVPFCGAERGPKVVPLAGFHSLDVCTPLNIAIVPTLSSQPDQYYLKIQGTPTLLSSLQGRVESGILRLETKASFEVEADAQLVVSSSSPIESLSPYCPISPFPQPCRPAAFFKAHYHLALRENFNLDFVSFEIFKGRLAGSIDTSTTNSNTS